MKKCTYCGKDYPDDAVRCLVDEQALSGDEMAAQTAGKVAVSSLPAPGASASRQFVLTDRQMEILEVVLVCIIAFGSSFLISTYVFLGGDYDHKHDSIAWLAQALREGSCLALLWYLLRRRGRSFLNLGLAWSWKDLGWSVILVFAGSMAFRIIYLLVNQSGMAAFVPKGVGPDVGKFLFGGGIFVSTFLFQFINPFFEELLSRAYLMTEVRRLTNSGTIAVLISTAFQTSYHLYQGGLAALAHGGTFLIFSIYYAKTNRIAPIILAHLYLDVGATVEYLIRS